MEKLGDNSFLEEEKKHIRRTIIVPTFAKVYALECFFNCFQATKMIAMSSYANFYFVLFF